VSKALVIVPTYNECENIEAIVEAVFSQPVAFHLLIVDDGSPDGTGEIVKQLQLKFNTAQSRLHLIERAGKQGLGTAYIEFGLAQGFDYFLEMDADFSHNPSDLNKLHHACAEENADMSIGSRYVNGVNVINWPMGRVLMSYCASMYVRFVTRMNIQDTTAGFVCYRRIVLGTIPLDRIRFVGYAFQIEMKFTAWKFGFKLVEVPIVFTDRTKGQSKMSTGIFKEAFLGVIRMKVSSWFRRYPRD
jgi:dolichol-phosphate mannosyltransferase